MKNNSANYFPESTPIPFATNSKKYLSGQVGNKNNKAAVNTAETKENNSKHYY
jgi:hypothetical protein